MVAGGLCGRTARFLRGRHRQGLGLKIGDTVTVNVLGRNVTARIANLREVKWESLALNFVMVFSPNTLAGAPHNLLATVTLPDAPLAAEAKLAREIGRAFPATTAIRVKDAIDAFNAIFGRVMMAVRAAGSVTLVAGALCLPAPWPRPSAGASSRPSSSRRSARRAAILLSHLAGILDSGRVNVVDCLADRQPGGLDHRLPGMDLDFAFSGQAAAEAWCSPWRWSRCSAAIGTWRVLKAPPVPYLRSE